jgi:Mn-dependent DtxR family transcriptional regulator
MDAQDPDIQTVAFEIERYLNEHPQAADMMENIARWWILRQRIEAGLSVTQQALDHLEAQGIVERSPQGLYRLVTSGRGLSRREAGKH